MPDRNQATEREHALARQLLAAEDDANADPEGLAEALVQTLNQLGASLQNMIGMAGYEALLSRALHLAGREWPFLQGIRTEVSPDGAVRLPGLVESVRGQDPPLVRPGLVAILANLLWLLVTFVGEAVGLHLIHRAFPGMPPGTGGVGLEGKNE